MNSKRTMCLNFLKSNNCFKCPYCDNDLFLDNDTLKCKSNHTFNISKKGDLFLINNNLYKNSLIYNYDLFKHRRNFILNGYYQPIYEFISNYINSLNIEKINILDLGCGEGTHSKLIQNNLKSKSLLFGLDYSKDAIKMATDYITDNNIYFLGDINNIPIKNNYFDIIIDFLSPYNSLETARILKKDGYLIKVVPSKNYLKELRNELNMNDYEKIDIVKNNLLKHFDLICEKEINICKNISEEGLNDLLCMTPIKNKKDHINNFSNITINMIIYILKLKY